MLNKMIVSIAMVAVTATSALASDFRATNKMRVNVENANEFEVSGLPRLGNRSYYCAAGQFGLARLGLSKTDKLIVTRANTRRDGPVVFTTSRTGVGAGNSPAIAKRNLGRTLSVGQAESYCADYRRELHNDSF